MEDDLGFADRCVGKLACFRVKELKDVLTQLQLSKQGKKQDLMDRIISLLYDEETPGILIPNNNISAKKAIVDVIDDVYRKMKKTEASSLATIEEGNTDIGGVMPKEESADVFIPDGPVRCPCGSLATTEFMIQCVDPDCQVQQHFCCVIVLENPTDTISSLPPKFYCEVCRIKRADPFWEPLVQLFFPMKLPITDIPTDGSNPVQFVEKTFQLTRSYRNYLQETNCDIQAWCILLNDSVPYRMQWPQYANLQVNGMAVRTVSRPGSQLLGANGRDDVASIKLHLKEGVNTISLSACDSRVFCFGLRLARRRTIQEVLNMIPKEADGERFEDALARIRRCTGGGMAAANEDSDSDIEIIADLIMVNLRCPLSGSRIKIAGRFKPCAHMGCFDLETFVELSQRSRKWQCPICLKNYSVEDIIIDPYFNRITTMMQHCGEDMTEIDLKPDGSWSARTNGESCDLAQWHFPDGSISATSTLSNSEFSNFVGQASHAVTMSYGASGSWGDVGDLSTDQGCSGKIDILASNGNEIDSIACHFDPSLGILSGKVLPSGEADVIVLSDSEDESVPLVSPDPICSTAHVNDNDLDLTLDAGLSSSLDLLNGTRNNTSLSQWPYPSGTQSGSGLQLFGTGSDITDVFTRLKNASVACSDEQMNGYTLASMSTVNSDGQVLDSSVDCTNTDYMDEGLINDSLPFVDDDPYLRRFLPTQPATAAVQSDLRHQPSVSNVIDSAGWISLRVGNNGDDVEKDAGAHPDYTSTHSLNVPNQYNSNEESSKINDKLDHTSFEGASRTFAFMKLMGFTTELTDEEAICDIQEREIDRAKSPGPNRKTPNKLCGGPFSFPRQPRSARRTCNPADSD